MTTYLLVSLLKKGTIMNLAKYARARALAPSPALLIFSAPAWAGDNPKVAAEVIALRERSGHLKPPGSSGGAACVVAMD